MWEQHPFFKKDLGSPEVVMSNLMTLAEEKVKEAGGLEKALKLVASEDVENEKTKEVEKAKLVLEDGAEGVHSLTLLFFSSKKS
jgi:hypothetical protein